MLIGIKLKRVASILAEILGSRAPTGCPKVSSIFIRPFAHSAAGRHQPPVAASVSKTIP